MIIIIATFGQAISGSGPTVGIIGALIVWRFLMGVGIGGDYPLSAVISSEFAATRSRGRLMTAVFAFQGWGNFSSSSFVLSQNHVTNTRNLYSCRPCLAYHCRRFQEPNHQRPLQRPQACRLLLASAHRPRLSSRLHGPVLPTHYSRNAPFHHGYRA
jgi:hypothetical protein